MISLHLCIFVLILIITVQSKEKTFKNVTLQTKENVRIATIIEDDYLKKYLPDYHIDRLVVQGKIPVLNEDSLAGITNVKHIFFYKNEIEEIRSGAFRNLQVEHLEFAYTNLTIIKRGAFNDLSAKMLIFSKNPKLTSIEDGAFDNQNIETLVFSENPLKSFSKNAFRKLPNLRYLLLKDGQIENVDKEVFAGLGIHGLDLTGNLISQISPDVIINLKNLTRVFLDSNRLTSIPSGIFNNHRSLQEVSLNANQISFIASDAFDNMPNLRKVTLALNNLTKIDPDWFRNCPHLNEINYVRNFIEEIPDDAFKNFRNEHPKFIRIFENKIRKIAPSAFKGLKTIDILSLSDNLIERWDEKFLEDAESVKKLDLFANKIVCPDGDPEKIFKAKFTHLGANPLAPECLETISGWNRDNEEHFVCTKWLCSVN